MWKKNDTILKLFAICLLILNSGCDSVASRSREKSLISNVESLNGKTIGSIKYELHPTYTLTIGFKNGSAINIDNVYPGNIAISTNQQMAEINDEDIFEPVKNP